MTGIERIIYESRATGSTSSLLNMAAILSVSQRNNDRDGLSGILAAHGDRYIQVVEGPSGAIDQLLGRLAVDRRHKEILIVDRRPIGTRLFGEWSMANARFTPEISGTLDEVMAAPSAERLLPLFTRAVFLK